MKSDELIKPFLLKPAGKDYIWGGHRLKDDFGKAIDMDPLAETWECSTHPNGESLAASGVYAGMTLRQILAGHPEYIGGRSETGDLPILVKLIDARRWLSVQVHPDDDYAILNEEDHRGKIEMWYVLEAGEGSSLVLGFDEEMTEERVRREIADGSISRSLHYIKPRKGDVFLIRPGTVHAIGAGLLIAEVQESSDLTYRLYDYDRVGRDGKKRPLHLEKALDVVNLGAYAETSEPVRIRHYYPGYDTEFLCRCRYFAVERLEVNTRRHHRLAPLELDPEDFCVLLCTEGCGMLYMEDGESLEVFKGDCFFIPTGVCALRLHGVMTLLKIQS